MIGARSGVLHALTIIGKYYKELHLYCKILYKYWRILLVAIILYIYIYVIGSSEFKFREIQLYKSYVYVFDVHY